MKYLLLLVFSLIPFLALADDASQRATAIQLIELVKVKDSMRTAFAKSIDSMTANAPAGQVTSTEATEMKQAMLDWFDTDFKWADLQTNLVQIYSQVFTEDEMKQLIVFYKTPVGQKTLDKMPDMMRQVMAMGQQYAASKQDTLLARLEKIDLKYHPAPAASSSTSVPASVPAVPGAVPPPATK